MDVSEAIRTQPMRALQWRAVIICLLLTMIDGFEILVMAFVAPHLAKAWALSPVQVGYLLSAGVFGMAIGATLLSPLADRIGRRRHVILCLAFITLGMALSSMADSVPEMVVYRAGAGVFIGALVASLNITVAEYCSDRRRGVVMGVYGIGFPLGAALGGAASALLIAQHGWRAPFMLGAIISGVMLLVVVFALPESIAYLVERRPAGALDAYNRIARALGYPAAAALPRSQAQGVQANAAQTIFGGVIGRRTVFLWLGFALITSAFYFANSWTAKLIADSTGVPALGVRAGVMVPLGGVAGALLFAALSLVIRPRLATMLVMLGGTLALWVYSRHFSDPGLALALAFVVGMFANGGIAAFYAISPTVYPAAVRATAIGWMFGFGRAVAILTPVATGYLLAAGWKPAETFRLFAGVLVLAAVASFLLDRSYRGRSENPEAAAEPAAA
ncbi:MAG: MFS transporter [Proteobacteria bacterium]|nr:MFS transporter [Pseudomonadota bacterium]